MNNKIRINIELLLKNVVIFGSFLAVLIPLVIMPQSYFPYIIQKTLLFRILIEIVILAYFFLAVLNKDYRPKKSLIFWFFSAFILVMLATTFTSQSITRSWWGNWERMFGTFFYLHFYLWFLALAGVFKRIKYWNYLLNISLFASVIICLYSISQRLSLFNTFQSGLERVNGTIGNAAFLSSYLLFHFFIALLFFVEKNHWKARLFYGLVALLELFVIVLTGTRGAILGLAASVAGFIVLAIGIKMYKQKTIKYILIFLLTVLILSPVMFLAKDVSFIKNNYWLNRFTNISINDNTVQTRLRAWKYGLKGFRDNFILGVGPENFQIIFNKYFEPDFYDYSGDEIWFDRAHNTLVDIAVTMGIFGFLAYLGIFVAVFYSLSKLKNKGVLNKNSYVVILLLFIAYFVQNIFVFDSLNSLIIFTVLLAYLNNINFRSDLENYNNNINQTNFYLSKIFIVSVFSAVIFGYLFFSINIKDIKANSYIYQAQVQSSSRQYAKAIEYYKKAYNNSINKIDPAVVLSSALGELIDLERNEISLDEKISDINTVIELMDKAIFLDSKNMYLYYIQARNYSLAAELTKDIKYIEMGIKEANLAHELSVNRVRPYWVLAQLNLFAENYDEAILNLNKAIQLNPRQADSYYYLAIIYKAMGEMDKFYEQYDLLIEYKYGFFNVSQITEVVQHYDEIGDIKSLTYLFERLVKLDNKKINYWQALVDLYVKDTQYEKALITLKKAADVIPTFSRLAWNQTQEIKKLIEQQENENTK